MSNNRKLGFNYFFYRSSSYSRVDRAFHQRHIYHMCLFSQHICKIPVSLIHLISRFESTQIRRSLRDNHNKIINLDLDRNLHSGFSNVIGINETTM